MSQLQLEEIKRLVKSDENSVETQQYVQNRAGTKLVQKVKEQHIVENDEDEEEMKKIQNYW